MTNSLFGMVVNSPTQAGHFPTVPFSSLRLWDTVVTWADLETAPGVFNWSNLDAQLAVAAKNGQDVLYTFGKVPAWANGSTNLSVPPNDIALRNVQFKKFVAELVFHSVKDAPMRISAYEIWNEPNLSQYWSGTQAQLLQMAHDAYNIIKAIDPSAIVVGPACDGGGLVKDWLTSYYQAGGPADVLNFHGYLDDYKPVPTSLAGLLNDIAAKKSSGALPNKPVWFTEGSWGKMANYATPLTDDQKVAYLAQMYVQMFAGGVSRFYWYAWDNTSGWGQLWTGAGQYPAGVAYGVLSVWLSGALSTGPITANANGTLTAPLAMANGVPAQIVWHPTQAHSLSTSAISYSSLDGKTFPVKNGAVTVVPKPILLVL